MGQSTINVARDFSKYPAGRFVDDGPFSGAAFRDRFLLPALQSGQSVIVELDGVRGYGSSFLEEAFGGLVRSGFTPEQVKQLLILESDDASLIEEIAEYIDQGNEPMSDD
jgi:hypothetical protein